MNYLSVVQFAEMFGISRQTVWKWIKAKKLKVIRLGKLYRIPVSEVERIKRGVVVDRVIREECRNG